MQRAEKITEPVFADAVRKNLENSLFYPSLRLVISRFEDFPIFLWGGAVREPILRQIYPDFKVFEMSDFDLMVDDSDKKVAFNNHLKDIKSISVNRYGHPKWKIKKYLEVDIGLFSDSNKLRKGEDVEVCIETVIEGADLNTSAIAYDIRNHVIYSYGAIEAYRKKEVDINYPEGNDPYAQMPRVILHAHNLDFNLGKDAVDLIKKKYTPDSKEQIRKKLIYWGKQGKYDFVISRLDAIKANHFCKIY
jgi:hypothetical protein